MESSMQAKSERRRTTKVGVVTSNRMDKSVVVRVERIEGKIRVFFSGDPVLEVEDETLGFGRVGVGSRPAQGAATTTKSRLLRRASGSTSTCLVKK